MPDTRHVLLASRLFDGARFAGPAAVLLGEGRILDMTRPDAAPAEWPRTTLPKDVLLAPGFIDVQVNGGGGVLLNDQPTSHGMAAIAAAHRPFGTTGCLPTLITDRRQIQHAALAVPANAPGVLGLHLEGPFISPARPGVHPPERIAIATMEDAARLADAAPALITLAPECVPRGFIRRLTRAGTVVCAGHSIATAAQMAAAMDEGLTGVTHLFNAMPSLAGREPGIIGLALTRPDLRAGIICDGLHVDPISLRVAFQAMGRSRLMLVTDAMPTVGAASDRFHLLGRDVRLKDGRLSTPDGTLAGAHLDMMSAVRRAMALMGADLADALAMASATPAAFLGQAGHRGRVAPGHEADLVALDAMLAVWGTWIGGAFQAGAG